MSKTDSQLKSDLQSYGIISHNDCAQNVANRSGNWSVFAAAAGSALALATSGTASIIYSGIQNVTASNGTQNINIDGAVFKLHASAYNGFFGTYARGSFAGLSSAAKVRTSGGSVKNLASGDVISAAGPFGGGGAFVGSGFVGIDVKTGGNQEHLGWVRLSHPDISTEVAIDWAYNSVAGDSILAGQESSSTPEPGSLALTLLAAGSAGVLAWRRRNSRTA